jgi:hypothetical protein
MADGNKKSIAAKNAKVTKMGKYLDTAPSGVPSNKQLICKEFWQFIISINLVIPAKPIDIKLLRDLRDLRVLRG